MVWCSATGKGFPPPIKGWIVPVDGDPEIESLRVSVDNSRSATYRSSESSTPEKKPQDIKSTSEKEPQKSNGYGDKHESNDRWEVQQKPPKKQIPKKVTVTDFRQLLLGKWNGVDGKNRKQWHEIKDAGKNLICTSWTKGIQDEKNTKIRIQEDGSVLWGYGEVTLDTAKASGEKVTWRNPKGNDWLWSSGW
eukprot:gnl/MRDRNA2_/MRDRNA2_64631_c0_seq1.p1 gnl/MRDRNA2_/MRDRNA2_64631_c0~~gnl/MRDRNA2_/MRDRNA2_64631_c0_seq1.p1  ORF type:complete len:192 (+),score=38.52 gnl/MRDRNA2_/MRDRNA2_64631_c0_seq1:170-745(+)